MMGNFGSLHLTGERTGRFRMSRYFEMGFKRWGLEMNPGKRLDNGISRESGNEMTES